MRRNVAGSTVNNGSSPYESDMMPSTTATNIAKTCQYDPLDRGVSASILTPVISSSFCGDISVPFSGYSPSMLPKPLIKCCRSSRLYIKVDASTSYDKE
jgi:hypothetical protein